MSQVLLPPLSDIQVLPSTNYKDGCNRLKVLGMSNKLTRNNWIAKYGKIKELSPVLRQSFKGLPYISKHDELYFIKLQKDLQKKGLPDDVIYNTLRTESERLKSGIVEDEFYEGHEDDEQLYLQVKITDPEENKYINEHGEPSKRFSSPGVYGDAEKLDNDILSFKLEDLRAFHIAAVPVPAFPEQEAEVKGVCMNGNKESCGKVLAFAGVDYLPAAAVPVPIPVPATTNGGENVNNKCGCNKGIEMSDQTSTSTTGQLVQSSTAVPNSVTTFHTVPNTGVTLPNYQLNTQSAIETQKEIEKNSIKKNEDGIYKTQAQIDAENKEKERDELIKRLQKQNEEQKNFYLNEIIAAHIPPSIFKKEEEYTQKKDTILGFINKYGVSLEDSKWIITLASKALTPAPTPSVQAPNQQDKEDEKKNSKKTTAYAGFFNTEDVTSPSQTSTPKPVTESGSNSTGIPEEDYPIRF